MSKATAIVPLDPKEFAIVQIDKEELAEMFAENIGAQLKVSDLDRIKMPSGGAIHWAMPDGEPAKYFEGIIVYWDDRKGMWRKGIDESEGNSAPDCIGRMVEIGTMPGAKIWEGRGVRWEGDTVGPHDCETCKFNKFGSADKGKGKKCQDKRLMAIMTKEGILPILFNVPATSINVVKKYFLDLLSKKRLRYHQIVTRFSLFEDKNEGNIKYAKLVLEPAELLDDETRTTIKMTVETLRPLLHTAADQLNGETKDSAFSDADEAEFQAIPYDDAQVPVEA